MGEIIDFIKARQENCGEHYFVFVERDEGYVLQDESDPLGEYAEFIEYADSKGIYYKLIYECVDCGKIKEKKEYQKFF